MTRHEKEKKYSSATELRNACTIKKKSFHKTKQIQFFFFVKQNETTNYN